MYREAFYSAIRASSPRPAPDEHLAALAAAETRPDLRTFWELVAAHDAAALTAGDFSMWHHLGDPSPDGQSVCIGATHGGDLFVVSQPGRAAPPTIRLLSHEEGFAETGSWSDLESFIAERIEEYREQMQEDYPDDESEWGTDLDEYLSAK